MKGLLRSGIAGPIFIAVLILVIASFRGSCVGQESDSLCREIEKRLTTADGSPPIIQGERLRTDPEVLRCFYASRLYQPLWTGKGQTLPEVPILLAALSRAGEEGLPPEDYQRMSKEFQQSLNAFRQRGEEVPEALLADLELLLTDAFVSFGHDLSFGRVNTERVCDKDCLSRRQECLLGSLEEALDGGGLAELLRDLAPRNPAYGKLKEMLAHYRQVAERGGWPSVPAEGNLKRGNRNPDVPALRERLRLSGDLAGDRLVDDGMLFDDEIAAGLRRFQARHGIKPSGTVNPETLRLLNVPVEDEIRLIQLNLERWRWLPQDMGPLHVMINIPDYSLALIESQQTIMTMRVVIGRRLWNTPSFSARMKYLEINPVWNIPPSILEREIVPTILRDRGYIKKKNIRFYGGSGKGLHEVLPEKINWSRIRPQAFPYQVVQAAGPANPLGRVKFIFPNEENVYLHDTPSKHLFSRDRRTFSHGCIRIEKPLDLAAYILQRDQQWPRKKLMAEVNRGKTKQIILREPVNVHIVYFTAWVDDEGALQTRPDVYHSDLILDLALRERESLIVDPPLD
jgi:murein L,D-transpeptidase YcbB/YkuD